MENTAKAVKAVQNLRFCSKHITKITGCSLLFVSVTNTWRFIGGRGGVCKTNWLYLLFRNPDLGSIAFHLSEKNLTSLKTENTKSFI